MVTKLNSMRLLEKNDIPYEVTEFPDTERDLATAMRPDLGERVLIRAINAGQIPHAMHLHGYHFSVRGVSGRPWPDGPSKDTVLIAPGEHSCSFSD